MHPKHLRTLRTSLQYCGWDRREQHTTTYTHASFTSSRLDTRHLSYITNPPPKFQQLTDLSTGDVPNFSSTRDYFVAKQAHCLAGCLFVSPRHIINYDRDHQNSKETSFSPVGASPKPYVNKILFFLQKPKIVCWFRMTHAQTLFNERLFVKNTKINAWWWCGFFEGHTHRQTTTKLRDFSQEQQKRCLVCFFRTTRTDRPQQK